MPNLYVGGRWASPRAGGVRDVVNPWDQSVVAKVDEAGPEDVAEAVRYVVIQPKHVSIPELVIKPTTQIYF